MSMLQIKNLSKSFLGVKAIDQVSFDIQEGEIFSLIGPNGAGKTTIFNLVTGVFPPTSGEILFEERSLVGMKPYQIAEIGIGRTFQIVQPFREMSVLDNVVVGALAKKENLKNAKDYSAYVLDFLGMGKKKDVLAGNLTLPEQKRLEIAKALATKPKIILLDEVMAGLRPHEVDEAISLIRQIRESGVTIFLIEHVMRAVMSLSERIIVLNYGEVITIGGPQEVLNNQKVIDAYLGEELDFVKS